MRPDQYRKLVSAGLNPDQIAIVMEVMGEDDTVRREKANSRWRKWKSNKEASNVGQRLQTLANDSRGDARGEDNLLPRKISGQEENKKEIGAPAARGSGETGFRDELPEVDAERLDAIVQHRRAKRGQVTALSARLFRQDAASCGLSISDAIDTCISRNWITVKPEFLAGKQHSHAPPPNRKPNAIDAYQQIAREKGWTEDEPEILPGHNGHAQRLPAERSGHSGAVVDLRPGDEWHRGSSDS